MATDRVGHDALKWIDLDSLATPIFWKHDSERSGANSSCHLVKHTEHGGLIYALWTNAITQYTGHLWEERACETIPNSVEGQAQALPHSSVLSQY